MYIMKINFFILSLVITSLASAQEIKVTATSAVPKNTVYFVEGKITDSLSLSKINPSSIASVNVVKRDTTVDFKKYDAQIFVLLKKNASVGPPKNNR